MALSTQEAEDENQYVLVLKIDNVRNMSNILKAIHFKDVLQRHQLDKLKKESCNHVNIINPSYILKYTLLFCIGQFKMFIDPATATVFASNNGLKVTVEDAKCVQANAFLQSEIFQEYRISEEQATFKVNLTVLLECLNIFGTSAIPGLTTALKFCYGGYGYPLILLLEENGVLTDCSIKTYEPDDTLDFNFCSTNMINKIIMKSECLKEAFSELDMTSDVLEILMSPDKPYFRLSTFGNAGSMHSDFPKDSDMVESFQCTRTQTNRYKVALLKPSVKALALSAKISIRTDDRGFLSLQYMIRNDDGQICFVEFYCSPDEDLENDNDS